MTTKPTRKPRRARSKRNQPLRATITKDGLLSITIGVDLLAYAVQASPDWDSWGINGGTMYRVIDNDLFASDIRNRIAESGNDTPPIQNLLDCAAREVCWDDDGATELVPPAEHEKECNKRMKGNGDYDRRPTR